MIDALQLRSVTASPPEMSGKSIRHPVAEQFALVLEQTLRQKSGIRFSAHARQRLESRGIELSEEEMKGIGKAMDQASAKGARESLFLLGRVALVVNVPNRTVITALPNQEAENSVFTNIDSAVVVPNVPVSSPSTESNRPAPLWGGLSAAE
ncbi:MAG TPA: TIGR02530 family flagellar biosynthesis protein [Candidatus Hydrogenedentes bacterium]|nr:TIGR02530 family flagellar biosynthesis protein [Candidatus Hydrogenedentota bacterium]